MIFDTEINGVIYSIDGELEGDQESPELVIDSIELYGDIIDKKFYDKIYKDNKDTIDRDAIDQAKWEDEYREVERNIEYI